MMQFLYSNCHVTMALPGLWIKKRQKIPLILWVLDLWPESISSASNIKNRFLLKSLHKLVKHIYDRCDLILISSEFFRKSITEKVANINKPINYFPNWAEDQFINPNFMREKNLVPEMPKGKNIMFAGNIGEAQDFESILHAAEITLKEEADLNWIIVGEGRKLNWVKSEITKRQLSNVITLGRFPIENMPTLFKSADIMLVTLKDSPSFALTVPAKIQAYMASSKIILGMLNGEGFDLVNNSKCGISVKSGDYIGLANNAVFLSNISEEQKAEYENNSIQYYKTHFEKEKLLTNLEIDILHLIESKNQVIV